MTTRTRTISDKTHPPCSLTYLGAHDFSTERAKLAWGTSLRSWFQKKCLLLMGILIFFPKNPRFWKLKLNFFPLKKVFDIFWQNTVNYRCINYLWPKFQQICGIFFFSQNTTDFETWSLIFSDRKSFLKIRFSFQILFFRN